MISSCSEAASPNMVAKFRETIRSDPETEKKMHEIIIVNGLCGCFVPAWIG